MIVRAQTRPFPPFPALLPLHVFDNFLHNCRGSTGSTRLGPLPHSSYVRSSSLVLSFLGAIHKLRQTTHKYYRYQTSRISIAQRTRCWPYHHTRRSYLSRLSGLRSALADLMQCENKLLCWGRNVAAINQSSRITINQKSHSPWP